MGGLRITLASLIAFSALFALTSPLARSADAATLDVTEADLQAQVNAFRAARGLSTLAVSDTLTAAAKWMATDMSVQNYFAHTSLDGRTPTQRMADAGYPATATWT
ncbi:MAG: CAP domain-containing protein, partial [Chloroflexi bacterium]